MILDNHPLKFYQWEGDVSVLLDAVRAKLNTLAESWTREQKDHCLQETMDTFKVGDMKRCICGIVVSFGMPWQKCHRPYTSSCYRNSKVGRCMGHIGSQLELTTLC